MPLGGADSDGTLRPLMELSALMPRIHALADDAGDDLVAKLVSLLGGVVAVTLSRVRACVHATNAGGLSLLTGRGGECVRE